MDETCSTCGSYEKFVQYFSGLKEARCVDVNGIRLAQGTDQWRTFCERGNETSGSIKGGDFLDLLNDC
jgi:hypothetical protein